MKGFSDITECAQATWPSSEGTSRLNIANREGFMRRSHHNPRILSLMTLVVFEKHERAMNRRNCESPIGASRR
jgi:hypothetical protein